MTRNHLPITPHPGPSIYEFHIPARDGHPICVRAYRQSHQTDLLPLPIYLHGGGFVTSGLETNDASCRALAVQIPLLVLNVEYRLAPENLFPTGLEDCFDVAASNAPRLTRKLIDYFAGIYGAPPDDKRLSLLLVPSHANLARRAVSYVYGWDPHRDEALLFEQLLREQGISTQCYLYPGLPHGFWTTWPDLEVSKGWQRDLIEGHTEDQ
ncbi:alpha/beta-hydrolase [Penicillium alfredii]|uniref:Alpha/beta-hydrolase n=1 Tax=Penicillium alfredii TaxID=1506179 RepID=A0A9W9JYR0_9EURO|nr:alpha/beta-hydrolase [Penicillium alfredii]KAJ5086430.1 alpha/beta-hydrolase [Penicillium alfredii]